MKDCPHFYSCMNWHVCQHSTTITIMWRVFSWCCRWQWSWMAVERRTRQHLMHCWRHWSLGCCSSVHETSTWHRCRHALHSMKWNWPCFDCLVCWCHVHAVPASLPLKYDFSLRSALHYCCYCYYWIVLRVHFSKVKSTRLSTDRASTWQQVKL